MRLEVRLFGGLTERAGASRLTVELPEHATVAELRTALAAQHPPVAGLLARTSVTVDLQVAADDETVTETAQVALLPPVAGGAQAESGPTDDAPAGVDVRPRVRGDGRRALTGLRPPPLPVERAVEAVGSPSAGGVVSFVGRVRDHAPDLAQPVVGLDYEAYPEMAERVLAEIADEILAEHAEVLGAVLLHTVGRLAVGEHTILVACAAAHRGPAFDACREALERTKDRVPVFKREIVASGDHRWVGLDDPPQRDGQPDASSPTTSSSSATSEIPTATTPVSRTSPARTGEEPARSAASRRRR